MNNLEYPIIAIADLHGQREELEGLLGELEWLREWEKATLVFLGDYVDRGPDPKGVVDLILELATHKRVVALAGNHDLAMVKAIGLGCPREEEWVEDYKVRYDCRSTFTSYLGRYPDQHRWESDLMMLGKAMPRAHREFFSRLRWVAESQGHLFLHCGLSKNIHQSAQAQVWALRKKWWGGWARPLAGGRIRDHYPDWLGADRLGSIDPLPFEGKVQVTGHVYVPKPDVESTRIRLDTTGGMGGPLTACLLLGPNHKPVFVSGPDQEWNQEVEYREDRFVFF